MPDAPLVAHSPTEARLYLMVTPCPSCERGPLRFAQARTIRDEAVGLIAMIDATCGGCEAATSFTFQLPPGLAPGVDRTEKGFAVQRNPRPVENRSHAVESRPHSEALQEINATDEPSRIIDVAHWLTLFRMGAEEAGREPDKIQARELWIEVGQYLAEALKFYDDPDSDLPPKEAFFGDTSRARLRENPEQFSRQRLINLRAKLPSPSAASSRGSSGRGSKNPPRRGGDR